MKSRFIPLASMVLLGGVSSVAIGQPLPMSEPQLDRVAAGATPLLPNLAASFRQAVLAVTAPLSALARTFPAPSTPPTPINALPLLTQPMPFALPGQSMPGLADRFGAADVAAIGNLAGAGNADHFGSALTLQATRSPMSMSSATSTLK